MVRREAELRARIVAVCDEHQCDETCELIDCEHPAGYWVSIERVRAVLFPVEEYVRGVHQNGERWRVRREPFPAEEAPSE